MRADYPAREYWFGLQWSNTAPGARWTQARQAGQAHWVCSMEPGVQAIAWTPEKWLKSRRTRSVLRLAQKGPQRGSLKRVQAYSAAACLAAHHPKQNVMLLWAVAPGLLWFLVLEQGVVVESSDCLLAQLEQVHSLRQTMKQRYPDLRELRQPDDLWLCLEQGRRAWACLQRQPEKRRWGFKKIPIRLLFSSLLVATLSWAALSADWGAWVGDAAAGDVQEPSSVSSASASTQAVLRLIESLPYQGTDWQLQQVDCQRQALMWECQAQYGFEQVQSFSVAMQNQIRGSANRLELMAQGQASLTLKQPYVEQIDGLPVLAQPPDLFSELATLQPVFMQLSLDAARPLGDDDAVGEAGQAKWRRAWRSQSPLRSAYLLADQLRELQWHTLRLRLESQSYPSLLGSAFIVELEGYVYETTEQQAAERAQIFEHSVWDAADV